MKSKEIVPDDIIARVNSCDDPAKLRTYRKNAKRLGYPEVERAAFVRLTEILPQEKPGTLEHSFWQVVHTFEELLSEERGRRTPLARTRQKVRRVGEKQTLIDWCLSPSETQGFEMLAERNMLGMSGEAIVLRHKDEFAVDVIAAAKARLEAAGFDVASLAG